MAATTLAQNYYQRQSAAALPSLQTREVVFHPGHRFPVADPRFEKESPLFFWPMKCSLGGLGKYGSQEPEVQDAGDS